MILKAMVALTCTAALAAGAQAQSAAPDAHVAPAAKGATAPDAQDHIPIKTKATETPLSTAAAAKIIMYRPSAIMGAGIACPIRYKEREIVELGRGKYAEWAVPAGHYILTNKSAGVDIRIGPGETAYVRCQIKAGSMIGQADLQIVDEESFAKHKKGLEKKDIEITTHTSAQH